MSIDTPESPVPGSKAASSSKTAETGPAAETGPEAADGIRSQEEMCERFIPILKEKGTIVHKKGMRMARLAKKGEEVLTIVDGEVVARKTVHDDTSMVIRQESADNELYCLDACMFEKNYVTPGVKIEDEEKHYEELHKRGFKKYERKGQALIYQVTEDDVKFVPSGKFHVTFSPEPQPLRVGDYLVTGYPESREVYMSRHATIYQDQHLMSPKRKLSIPCHGPVRSQEEMCAHFIPILKERGTLVQKAGKRFARPGKRGEIIQTIIDGEVVAKTLVDDDTSMVIRQESVDNELYTLDARKFQENYETPGADIIETGSRFEVLRKRGFKCYTRRGQLLIYQVTAKDLEFVPEGNFQVAFSPYPQPLQLGDYLVTTYPDTQEIYMSRHDSIYKDAQVIQQAPFESTRTHTTTEAKDENRIITSQEDMCRHFIPILTERGHIVHKMGKRMARPAKKGEPIQTIINGEVVAKTIVKDETSMVIRQESADHELYVLDQKKFHENYELPGVDIIETEARFEELRQRGFKYYERKGQSLIYQVTERDMEVVPGGEFEVSFSADPQPLRVGDYLVTGYPDSKEVYMSRHASIYQDRQHFHGPGVKTQEEMRAHFLPKMKEQGMTLRRAGMRLARRAKRGEEVLTTINGEVMSKIVVADDTTMVIQEESSDREVYALSAEQFSLSYQQPGTEIEEQGSEFDILRERGFKYYEKTGGMVMMYRVTYEDMEFIPSGKFQVPFSIVPQPLKAGDHLITSLEPGDTVIYVSRNAEQIFMTQKNLEIHYVFGSPVTHPALSINAELDGLRTSGAIVLLTCATRENMMLLKKAWSGMTPTVLHVSCHTSLNQTGAGVILEDEAGRPNPVSADEFTNLVFGAHRAVAPEVVVLNSCNSQSLAGAFLDRGVRRVVAVRAQQTLLDRAARDFTLSFYGELRSHRSVEAAYKCALESMKSSKDLELAAEASKFVLLPEGSTELHLGDRRAMRTFSGLDSSLEPHIGVRVPFGVGEARCVGPLIYPSAASSIQGPIPLSRRKFLCNAMAVFANFRVLKMCGPAGIGKKALAELIATFSAQPGGRLFSGGTVIIHGRVGSGIASQQQMREHFLPILKEKGQLVQKVGRLMARRAHPGETVLTVINGEVVARKVVDDETSMVVRHDSADHELYVHSANQFAKHYETPGVEINDAGVEFDVLRERGFMYYERRGMALIYKVTEEDMMFVPEGKFQVTFSSTPQPLRVGDYIATGYPNQGSGEVYLSRNAEQVYLSKIIRSNEEMRRHFSPIMMKQGMIARRVGTWLARPAVQGEHIATIIGEHVVGRTVVADSTSMVVQADSADCEQYVLDAQTFGKSYKQPGFMITNEGDEFEGLREQGFMYYERKGMVRIYQVTEADLEFLPVKKFNHSRHSPQDLRIGDYLVCEYPDAGEVYVSRNAEQVFAPAEAGEVIRSQDDMREHFLPILKKQGKIMSFTGKCAARQAVKGEVIRTIIDGEMVAKATVSDDRSVVVREETSDRELYVLACRSFARFFKSEGFDITEPGYEFEALRERGFRWYSRRGAVLVYQVTAEDMEFVLGGKFNVPFSSVPQTLRVGDHIATEYPTNREIFLTRNIRQVATAVDNESLVAQLGLSREVSACSASFSLEMTAQGSPALWLKDSRRDATGEIDVDTVPTPSTGMPRPTSGLRESGLRERSELEEALVAAATRQAELARRWYNVRETTAQSLERNSSHKSQAEAAVAKWLNAVPSGSRALLVLVDADQFMNHAGPRELLRRLALAHQNLHILVSVTSADTAGATLDPSVKEHPWVVPLPPMEPREAAELFLFALLRRPQGRPLVPTVQMNRDLAIEKLEKHPTVLRCQGNPAEIFRRVEQIEQRICSFDDL